MLLSEEQTLIRDTARAYFQDKLMANLKAGDEILITWMEHHANVVPWYQLAAQTGAVIKRIELNADGTLHLDDLNQLITQRTKLVAVTQMSNTLGTVVPVKEVTRIAHARGIPVLIDGAQGARFIAFLGRVLSDIRRLVL